MSRAHLVIACPPGSTRPDDVLFRLCGLCGVIMNDVFEEANSKKFGEWSFPIKDEGKNIYLARRDALFAQLQVFHEQRIIRFADVPLVN